MMRAIAEAVHTQVFGGDTHAALRVLTWDQDCQAGHVPFRRDCCVCQEAAAKSRPHRRVPHPLAGTLSLDTAGPFRVAKEGKVLKKFILVGTFTWLQPDGGEPDPPPLPDEGGEDLPLLENEDAEDDAENAEAAEDADHGEEERGDVEERQEPKINVFKLCIAMGSKGAKEVLQTIN